MKTENTAERSTGEILRSLKTGQFTTITKIQQGGALQARRLTTGAIKFYWRYTYEGKSDRIPIGTYDSSAPPKSLAPTDRGYSVAAATEACRANATVQAEKAVVGGYREHVAAAKRSHEAAKQVKANAEEHTLSKLLETYVSHLEKSGRRGFSDARSIFKHHVEQAYPDIANGPAVNLTAEQVTDMMRSLIKAGKGRTANKLRSYLRAAYQCALDVNSLAYIPATFKSFKIAVNPAALTKRDAKHDKADKNPLSLKQLKQYWKLLETEPGIRGAALRLHLLSGGQRIEQLCKLKTADVSKGEFTIYDAKGRPGLGPRKHIVPLPPAASAAVKELVGAETYVFSTDGGKTRLSAMTLSNWSQDVVGAAIPKFQLKRVRSGVETELARAGVSKEDRGHLQSHGLSGVQSRHYDDYDYVPEKRAALNVLFGLLEGKPIQRHAKSSK